MKLKGKSALITGAARGIGKAFAEAYIREGATVCIADINEEGAKATAAELGSNAFALAMDVTEQASIDNAVAVMEEKCGGIDILINNAAIFSLAGICDVTREDYQKVFAINFEGALFTLQAVAKSMIRRGKGGKIINMASQAGRRGESLVTVYCATKAAMISLTQSAALNLIEHGINVNAIAPGVVNNEHWDGVDAAFARAEGLKPGEKKAMVDAGVPFGRMARPDEIAPMAVFLASSESDYILAQCYNVDGGQWMS
ncbi:MAG: L-iditol 2-dehydrogenase [Tropicimonas sp.]|uniref:L-iditol 2-dehydrogenase n=1 Tax=Tropicimonas sp. TaxID=2067044 RepID=UPI003A8BF7A8